MPKPKPITPPKTHDRPWGDGTVKEVRPGVWRAWRARVRTGSGSTLRPSRTFSGPDAAERAALWARGDVEPSVLLLGHWLDRWLALKLPIVRPRSRERYRQHVAQCGPIAMLPLAELTTERLQLRANELLADHKRNTVAAWRATVSSALKSAVPLHLPANPMNGVKLGTPEERPVKAWRADEVQRLVAAAAGRAHETWLWLSLGTGLRLGESRALLWTDVDLTNLTILVSKSLDHKRSTVGPTKNGRTRIVDLPDELVPVLRQHRARQQPRETHVCTSAGTGRLPSAGAIYKWLGPLTAACGVTPLSPHSTRHTFATLALEAGVPLKEVSEALGHADVAITARIYSHALNVRRRQASAALGAVLAGRAPTPIRRNGTQDGTRTSG